MSSIPWFQRLGVLSFDCNPRMRAYFAAVAIICSGLLVEGLAFRVNAELRIATISGCVALVLIYLKANQRSFVVKAVAAVAVVLAAILSPDPTLVGVAWLVFVVLLQPDGQPLGSTLVRLTVVILILHLFVVRSGALLGWDDRVGRELVSSMGAYLGHRTEKISLLGLFGPWLGLWAASVLALAMVAPNKGSRFATIVRTLFLLIAPTALCLVLVSPLPLTIAVGLLAAARPETEVREVRAWPIWTGIAAGAILSLAAALPAYSHARIAPLRTVAIAKVELGTTVPQQGAPTTDKIKYEANFARLIRFLRRQGVSVTELSDSWTQEELQKHQTVIFINRRTKATAQQIEDLYAAVGDGVRLVVAADHTDIMGVLEPANQLLRKVPIRVRFDSAMPFFANREWHKALWLNPAVRAIVASGGSLNISVGASLQIWGNAEPLVVGHAGFSDPGDRDNPPGFLANMEYNPGEPVYDIPLVAQAPYGKGSVLCLGDTSSFQDSALIEAGPFVLNLLAPRPSISGNWLLLSAALVAGVGLLLMSDMRTGRTPWISGGFLIFLLFLQHEGFASQRTAIDLSDAIVFDRELGPKVPGFFLDQKIDKLSELCDRQNVELIADSASRAARERARALLICAPTLMPSDSAVKTIEAYVRGGGRLFLSCGADSAAVGNKLLDPFGMTIRSTPLGGVDATELVDDQIRKEVTAIAPTKSGAQFGLLIDAYEVTGGERVIAKTLGKPSVVLKKVGKGEVLVVSDSRFLTSKCLGQELNLNLPPARFLYALIAHITK